MTYIPQNIHHIHLTAICGTGMGSLAGLLVKRGFKVTGSDQNTYPPMSTQLENLGIKLFTGYKPENLNPKPDLVIVGNAIPKTNPEAEEILRQNIPYTSMAAALSHFFITGKESIVISGTHGKTTTTALLSHLLVELSAGPSYLIGGILQEDLPNHAWNEKGKYFVVEGDEYDTAFFDKGPKFWHYQPHHTIITSLEFDHADIYRDLDHLCSSFEKLIEKINPKGFLLYCNHYPRLCELVKKSNVKTESYGLKEGNWSASNFQSEQPFDDASTGSAHRLRVSDSGHGKPRRTIQPYSTFTVLYRGQREGLLHSPLMGDHNIQNVLAAYALLRHLGFGHQKISEALQSFKGVKRRQEIRGTINNIIVMDDFAHHPTAVRETIAAVKKRFPKHTLWAIFEPRSNSSKRNIFQKDYGECFTGADQVIMADVFMPEKVKDGHVLDVDTVVKDVNSQGIKAQHISGVENIVTHLALHTKPDSIVLIMSNGGFGGIHEKLLKALLQSDPSRASGCPN
ncbi:MAG: hypothetical protein A2048_00735 [Deltaproteobacteria bacterium GWA2_45_12]|nr:MAG: hypothetical protein A2048_00735 [Deltaproteobacteria bacterium GWA2_45_12]